MDVAVCLADNEPGPHLLNHAGDLQTVLEIISNADEADIKIPNPKAFQHSLIGTITNLGADHIGKDRLQLFFRYIYCHDLVVMLCQILTQMLPEPSDSDYKN